MITLITGGPGMGKSALAVKLLVTQYSNRPIFTNIKGLTLEHSKLPKLEEWTVEEENDQGTFEHYFTFPAGAIVVIDECQQFFRPRATGARVPPYVSAFETHRHKGIDFILITQGSGLLDANIRKLVKGGLHIFLKSSYVGRFRYEKSEVINEDDKSSYGLATKRKYKLPSDVFHLYKSAELHTKPPRAKLPMAAFVIVLAVVVGGALAYRASSTISSAINGDKAPGRSEASIAPGAAEPTTSAIVANAVMGVPDKLMEAMTPRDDQNPLSAPLYAAVAPPVVPPEIQGCISSKRACTCYSQQQTPVWLPEEQCRKRAAGEYYDPYRVTPREPAETKSQTTATAIEAGSEVPPAQASETPSAML